MVIISGSYTIQCFDEKNFKKAKEIISKQKEFDPTIQFTIDEIEMKITVNQTKTQEELFI